MAECILAEPSLIAISLFNDRPYAVAYSDACLACGSKVLSIYFSKIFTLRVKILEKKKGNYHLLMTVIRADSFRIK